MTTKNFIDGEICISSCYELNYVTIVTSLTKLHQLYPLNDIIYPYKPAPIVRAPKATSTRDWSQGEMEILVEINIVLWVLFLLRQELFSYNHAPLCSSGTPPL